MARAIQVHVVWVKPTKKSAGVWALKKAGNFLGGFRWRKKTEAIQHGRIRAKELKAELVIHNKNGKIARKHSFGNDPRRSKG